MNKPLKPEQDWKVIQKWSIQKRLEYLNDCFRHYDDGFATHMLNCVFEKEMKKYWERQEKTKTKKRR